MDTRNNQDIASSFFDNLTHDTFLCLNLFSYLTSDELKIFAFLINKSLTNNFSDFFSEEQLAIEYPNTYEAIQNAQIEYNGYLVRNNMLYQIKFQKDFPELYSFFFQMMKPTNFLYWETRYQVVNTILELKKMKNNIEFNDVEKMLQSDELTIGLADYAIYSKDIEICKQIYNELKNQRNLKLLDAIDKGKTFTQFLEKVFYTTKQHIDYFSINKAIYSNNQVSIFISNPRDEGVYIAAILNNFHGNKFEYSSISLRYPDKDGKTIDHLIYQDSPFAIAARLHLHDLFNNHLKSCEDLTKENEINCFSALISAIYGRNANAIQSLLDLPSMKKILTLRLFKDIIQSHLIFSLLKIHPIITQAEYSDSDEEIVSLFFNENNQSIFNLNNFIIFFIEITSKMKFENKDQKISYIYALFSDEIYQKKINHYFESACLNNHIEMINVLLNHRKKKSDLSYFSNSKKYNQEDFQFDGFVCRAREPILDSNEDRKKSRILFIEYHHVDPILIRKMHPDLITYCINSDIYCVITHLVHTINGFKSTDDTEYETDYILDSRTIALYQLRSILNDEPCLDIYRALKHWVDSDSKIQEILANHPGILDLLFNEITEVQKGFSNLFGKGLSPVYNFLPLKNHFKKLFSKINSFFREDELGNLFSSLSKEIVERILKFLRYGEILSNIILVNRTFNKIARENSIWSEKIKIFPTSSKSNHHFPYRIIDSRFYFDTFIKKLSKKFLIPGTNMRDMAHTTLIRLAMQGLKYNEMNAIFWKEKYGESSREIKQKLIKEIPKIASIISDNEHQSDTFFSNEFIVQIKKELTIKEFNSYFLIIHSPLIEKLVDLFVQDQSGMTLIDWFILNKDQNSMNFIFELFYLNAFQKTHLYLFFSKKNNYKFKNPSRDQLPRPLLFDAVRLNQITHITDHYPLNSPYTHQFTRFLNGGMPYDHQIIYSTAPNLLLFIPCESAFSIAALECHNDLLKLLFERFVLLAETESDLMLKQHIFISALQAAIYADNLVGYDIILSQKNFPNQLVLNQAMFSLIMKFFFKRLENPNPSNCIEIFKHFLKKIQEKNEAGFHQTLTILQNKMFNIILRHNKNIAIPIMEIISGYYDEIEIFLIHLCLNRSKDVFLHFFNFYKEKLHKEKKTFSGFISAEGVNLTFASLIFGDPKLFFDVMTATNIKFHEFRNPLSLLISYTDGFKNHHKAFFYSYSINDETGNIDYNIQPYRDKYAKYVHTSMFYLDIMSLLLREIISPRFLAFYQNYNSFREHAKQNINIALHLFSDHSVKELYRLFFKMENSNSEHPAIIYADWKASLQDNDFFNRHKNLFIFLENSLIKISKKYFGFNQICSFNRIMNQLGQLKITDSTPSNLPENSSYSSERLPSVAQQNQVDCNLPDDENTDEDENEPSADNEETKEIEDEYPKPY